MLRNSSWSNFTISKCSNQYPLAVIDAENRIKFDPPMFKQRYERVTNILLNEKWKNQIRKIVDFGCSEMGLFVFLKNIIKAREMIFVDIDELLLKDYLFKIYPLSCDYLARRTSELNVKVFLGSVADYDAILADTDAVIAIELIEHLYPDVLDAFPFNVFSCIVPKLVIVTTPNAEFNVHFGKVEKFRHYDHKFEWTREQFESWARNVTERFPNYIVEFDGIGLGPYGEDNLGCCSQLALFIRKDVICDNYIIPVPFVNNSMKSSYGICTYNSLSTKLSPKDGESVYKLILEENYPFEIDERSEEEKIMDELKYRFNLLGHSRGVYFDYDRNQARIPLPALYYNTQCGLPPEFEIRSLLLKHNYQIEECLNVETNVTESCVIFLPEMDHSGSDSEASGYESDNKYGADEGHVSDWDSEEVQPKKVDSPPPKTQMHLEVSTGVVKKPEALIDSGYQKSPTGVDDSPQSDNEPIALDYKSLNDNKPNRLSNILSVFENFDRINELDAVRKERKHFNFSSNLPPREVMKKICQEIVKHPIAGPSRDSRKKSSKKSSQSSDSDESVEDVKAITTCILENSLNRIEVPNEEQPQRGHLIQELIEEDAPPILEVVVVENGDLANNNRDMEGNNYPPEEPENPELQADDNAIIDNIEANNINVDNNNDIAEALPVQIQEEVVEEMDDGPILVADIEVAWSSREALFDSNSHVDLLDDFDMDAVVVNNIAFPSHFVINSENDCCVDTPILPPGESNFPNWLLQIFEDGEALPAEDDMHDEPHFYCQGDGLGVHPSTVALDEEDDEGNESGTDSSSTSGSVDFANAENSSSIQEMFMTPDESRNDDNLVVLGASITDQSSTATASEADEEFQSAQESESNAMMP